MLMSFRNTENSYCDNMDYCHTLIGLFFCIPTQFQHNTVDQFKGMKIANPFRQLTVKEALF